MLPLFAPTSLVAAEGSSASSGVYAAGEFMVSPRRRMPRSTMLGGESIREKQQWSRFLIYPRIISAVVARLARFCFVLSSYVSVSSTISSVMISCRTIALNSVAPNREYRRTSMISSSVMMPIAPPAIPGVFEIKRRCALPVWLHS